MLISGIDTESYKKYAAPNPKVPLSPYEMNQKEFLKRYLYIGCVLDFFGDKSKMAIPVCGQISLWTYLVQNC